MAVGDSELIPGVKPSILVVDDNLSVLEVIGEYLRDWKCDALMVRTGSEALEALENRSFHLVLADLRMSPVSGWEVIRRARELEETEVVVMTGFASLDASLEAIRLRVFDFLSKPIDFDRLKRTVRNAVSHSLLVRENRRLMEQLARKNRELEIEIQKVRNELEDLSIRDELTGLHNYRYLMNLLDREITRSVRYEVPLTLAMIDLDNFKQLNDTYGHAAGNQALQTIAHVFTGSIRAADTACRFGGEEFSIVLPMTTPLQAEPILQRICNRIRREQIPIDAERVLTISIGVAACPKDAQTVDDLIRFADQALYSAKEKGKDQVVLAVDPSLP